MKISPARNASRSDAGGPSGLTQFIIIKIALFVNLNFCYN